LCAEERTAIEKMGSEGKSIREMARELGRGPSTVSREVRRVPISARPPGADDRTEFGHWEGDSIVGATKAAAIRTEVERKTRHLKARLVPGATSQGALDAQLAMFRRLPKAARKSTTCDNGSEHAKWAEPRKRLGTMTYFAAPYHSWERGANERANGLIRRHWPKRTNFEHVTSQDLQDRVGQINNRPMAILGHLTPAEALAD
ncbi:MAG: IS30 family transposase, partial [Bifidobacteriaceae bacterium]|jgi:IS30 family transposase|nr:IS30 family transposase [Bifidobacteriaceae bacterium]